MTVLELVRQELCDAGHACDSIRDGVIFNVRRSDIVCFIVKLEDSLDEITVLDCAMPTKGKYNLQEPNSVQRIIDHVSKPIPWIAAQVY